MLVSITEYLALMAWSRYLRLSFSSGDTKMSVGAESDGGLQKSKFSPKYTFLIVS